MEENRKLYPFGFLPLKDDYYWGSETFLLADLGYRDTVVSDGWLGGNAISEIMDMYMDRIVGDNIFANYGRQFPFQVKRITVKDGATMPLRVHPDDTTAADRYDFLGKEKLWYIVKAGKDACVFLGFKRDTDAGELTERCADGSVKDILDKINVKAGDFVTIHPGTVHAASGEIEIIEISESSPLDFCICNWGHDENTEEFDPAFGLIEAMDFIEYGQWKGADHELPFTVGKLSLHKPMNITSDQADTCLCYVAVTGNAAVQTTPDEIPVTVNLKEGNILLIPAETAEFTIGTAASATSKDAATVLEIRMRPAAATDSYTGEKIPDSRIEENAGLIPDGISEEQED